MKKIMIIEDDLSIAELQKDYLEVAGFYVMLFANGTEGLRYLQENTSACDLLILDIMLPGHDGLEILRIIRDKLQIPVLLVSAKKEEIDKIKGFNLGADDYITKPFSPGELVARVKAHLSNYERLRQRFHAEPPNTESLVIRGLKIDIASHRVFTDEKEVYLAQKEFETLLFLVQNPNRVFSRDYLFEQIWGLDALGDSATVTVHIARIRDKIEIDPANPQYIETVWGAGYRLRA